MAKPAPVVTTPARTEPFSCKTGPDRVGRAFHVIVCLQPEIQPERIGAVDKPGNVTCVPAFGRLANAGTAIGNRALAMHIGVPAKIRVKENGRHFKKRIKP